MCNSICVHIQGSFIFFFHVLRSDKVMSQVGKEMGLSRWNWEASEVHFTARK